MLTENSHDKNVVIVDGRCQEQCSGSLLYQDLREETPIQYVSALGGFGRWPSRSFLHDPRVEVNYWSTKNQECFPGRARMRRTVVQVEKQVYIVRDTLWSLDENEHDYEWLFHTFAEPGVGAFQDRSVREYQPKRIYYSQQPTLVSRKVDRCLLPSKALMFSTDKASLKVRWSVFGAEFPAEIGLSQSASRYAFNGSPETGDGFSDKMLNRLHLQLRGRDVVLTTVFIPFASGVTSKIEVKSFKEHSLNSVQCSLKIDGRLHEITGNEEEGQWISQRVEQL